MSDMTPREIIDELDKHIVGQSQAKRKVAIAMRNRWRRMHVAEPLRHEITPKNILMIGPTGVGKTEIARRLAKLANAPFIKVEATKFTEVGYVGRDVERIIHELTDMAVKMTREQEMEKVRHRAAENVEERILQALLPRRRDRFADEPEDKEQNDGKTRQLFRTRLANGDFDDQDIDIDVSDVPVGVEIMAPPGMEEMSSQLQNLFNNLSGNRKTTKRMTVRKAREALLDEEAALLINEEDIRNRAIESLEQNGIVFLDEIDKITARSERSGGDVSREGVQRDLLPLVEGCSVSTKYGPVKTDHILFIASGAFHLSKPADLIPELQGRLPIRVELNALSEDDFVQILTEPDASLTKQYHALMATEGVEIQFCEDGIRKIAELARQVNETTENIGARRLHTVMERLLEDVSFTASDNNGRTMVIDAAFVSQHLEDLVEDVDLARYIL